MRWHDWYNPLIHAQPRYHRITMARHRRRNERRYGWVTPGCYPHSFIFRTR